MTTAKNFASDFYYIKFNLWRLSDSLRDEKWPYHLSHYKIYILTNTYICAAAIEEMK